MERQTSEDPNEDFTEKQTGISNPLYQKTYHARKFVTKIFKSSLYPEAESDIKRLLDEQMGIITQIHTTGTRSPQTHTIQIDYTKKSPTR